MENKIKICSLCEKSFLSYGKNCQSCTRKIREDKRRGRPCSSCFRSDVLIQNQTLLLCVMCMRRKRYSEDPSYHQKRLEWSRRYDRKKSGRLIDSPLMRAPIGSGYIDKSTGYKYLSKKNFPKAKNQEIKNKYRIAEHTYVMTKYLGRSLHKGESIHHKNGIRHDNRIENLELWTKQQPAGQRVEDKIKWAKEFLELHDYEVKRKEHKSTNFYDRE